jgi:hypothetical protein
MNSAQINAAFDLALRRARAKGLSDPAVMALEILDDPAMAPVLADPVVADLMLKARLVERIVADADVAELAALQDRAQKLGCWIDQYDSWAMNPEINKGPYLLREIASDTPIWGWGLPLAGIVDALDCFERELHGVDNAWANFGTGWAAGASNQY